MGMRFFLLQRFQTRYGAEPIPSLYGYCWHFPQGLTGRGVKLTTLAHRVRDEEYVGLYCHEVALNKLQRQLNSHLSTHVEVFSSVKAVGHLKQSENRKSHTQNGFFGFLCILYSVCTLV